MPITVNVHEAKTHLSRLLEKVQAGEEIIIARAGQPCARLAPLADYLVVNLSSPNTPGLRTLQAPEVLAGLPVIMVTTTGARSGLPRTMPLAGIPCGDDLAVVGSNFAQPSTPAWVHNLEADPQATVVWRDRSVAVRARPATDAERELVDSE